MLKWLRDVVVIPLIITLLTGFGFMIWGAWYSGVKWHSPFSGYWLKVVFGAPIPLWFVIIIVGMASFISWKGYTSYRQLDDLRDANLSLKERLKETAHDVTLLGYWKIKSTRLEERVERLTDALPKVHVSWSVNGATWSVMKIKGDLYMSLNASATFSSSNATEVIALTKAYLPGTTAWANIMLTKIPVSDLLHEHVHVSLKPILARPGSDFRARLIFVDTKGNEYLSPEHTFQYVPPGSPPHPLAPSDEEMAALIADGVPDQSS